MSAAWFVIFAIFGLWGFGLTMVMIADWMVRRRSETSLETRAWEDKVDAMRRLQDREGDA
jgi:purine-cytosine permease-like protein